MNVNTLAAGVIGFLLGGLTVSTAAWIEDGGDQEPVRHDSAQHGVVIR